eukprot:jgi/Ulvmu1/1989/UM012_0151.1
MRGLPLTSHTPGPCAAPEVDAAGTPAQGAPLRALRAAVFMVHLGVWCEGHLSDSVALHSLRPGAVTRARCVAWHALRAMRAAVFSDCMRGAAPPVASRAAAGVFGGCTGPSLGESSHEQRGADERSFCRRRRVPDALRRGCTW